MLDATHVAAGAILGYYFSRYSLEGMTVLSAVVSGACAVIPNFDLFTQRMIFKKKITSPFLADALRRKRLLHCPQFYGVLWLFLRILLPAHRDWIANAFMVGTVSHCLLDLFTAGGISLMYPDKKLYSLSKNESGYPLEMLVLWPILALGIWRMMMWQPPFF